MKVREAKLNKSAGAKIAFGIVFALFALYALSIVYTLVWALLSSLKTNAEFFDNMINLPKDWLFSNFADALNKITYNETTFVGMYFNSLWFAVGSTVLSVFMHCVTGYIFTKYKFKGMGAAFSFILFTISLPIVGSLPSFYKIIFNMRINDSPLFLITALGGFSGNFLITYAFFKNVDNSYAEAAEIDGAGHLQIFLRIMIPLASPMIFALGILGFMGQWNNYETPILFLSQVPPLAAGLHRFNIDMIYDMNLPVYYAGILMSILPVLALVSVFGGKIMKNMAIGGLKG